MSAVLLYMVQTVIVCAYVMLVFRPRTILYYHHANAIGGTIILSIVLQTTGWQPIYAITVFFTLTGYVGIYKEVTQ